MEKIKCSQTVLVLNFFFCCFLSVSAVAQTTSKQKLTPREIAQQTLPSTVLLVMGDSNTKKIKSGSGFFVAEDVVVTNFHVIKETTEGYAKIYGQDEIYETLGIVGVDEKNDLALLKLNGVKGKPLKLNTDNSTAIGDEVFAVGNPEGLEGTFSQGIVSSIRKTEKFNLLQITASISPGSSGGAVLNDKGEVVGVAVGGIESGQSLNFAIPVYFLRSLILNQKPLVALKGNAAPINNKTQSNSNKTIQSPSNLPKITSVPQRSFRMQFKKPDLLEENLFGRIKTIKQSTFIPEKKFDEWVLGDPIAESSEKYNLEGYQEYYEEIIYSEKDPFKWLALTYDYKINKLPITQKRLYSYDYSKGLVIRENYWKCAECPEYELRNKFLTKYEGNEVTQFDTDGKVLWKKIEYKDKDNKTVILQFDKDGKPYFRESLYRDSLGEVREKEYISAVKKEKHNIIDDVIEDSRYSKTITTEDKNQLKETSVCIKDEKEFDCNKYILRDKATKLILREVNGQNITKYDYEFDSNGNWIKQTEQQQVTKFGKTYFEPTKVIIREIIYY